MGHKSSEHRTLGFRQGFSDSNGIPAAYTTAYGSQNRTFAIYKYNPQDFLFPITYPLTIWTCLLSSLSSPSTLLNFDSISLLVSRFWELWLVAKILINGRRVRRRRWSHRRRSLRRILVQVKCQCQWRRILKVKMGMVMLLLLLLTWIAQK